MLILFLSLLSLLLMHLCLSIGRALLLLSYVWLIRFGRCKGYKKSKLGVMGVFSLVFLFFPNLVLMAWMSMWYLPYYRYRLKFFI